jgi:integrase
MQEEIKLESCLEVKVEPHDVKVFKITSSSSVPIENKDDKGEYVRKPVVVIDDKEAEKFMTEGAVLVDVRGAEEYEKSPKSSAGNRKIPLPKDIKDLIELQPKVNDYIIQKNSKAIGAMFRRILEKNNIPHCRFHDLRHATASAMALLNIPDRYAMKIGGWDSPDVLRSIYQQTFTAEELAFSKLLSDFFTEKQQSISHEISHE